MGHEEALPAVGGVADAEVRSFTDANWRELSTIEGNLLTAAGGASPRTLLVTSCSPREGKTVAAAAMACALANTHRVLLIDANMQAPRLHRLFSVDDTPGFAEVVLGAATRQQAVRPTSFENLWLLPSGHAPQHTLGLFRSDHLTTRLADLAGSFDYVIIDGSHYLGPSDTAFLAPHCDGVILVIACEETRWEVVQTVQERLSQTKAKLLGAVMNKRRYYIPRRFYRFL